jgi:hypothetical protein
MVRSEVDADQMPRLYLRRQLVRLASATGYSQNRISQAGVRHATPNYSCLSFGRNSVRSKIHPLGHVRPVAAASRCTWSGEAPRLSAHRLHFGTVHDHHIQATRSPLDLPSASPGDAANLHEASYVSSARLIDSSCGHQYARYDSGFRRFPSAPGDPLTIRIDCGSALYESRDY